MVLLCHLKWQELWHLTEILTLLFFIILCIILIFFKYGCRIKTLVLFPVLMIGFALARPVIVMDQPQWPLIFNTESGGKYFHVTNIALACLAISLISVLPKYKNFTL